MSSVVNKTTFQYIQYVNTPDYDPTDWLINPDLSAVAGLDPMYWKVVAGAVVPMTGPEQLLIPGPPNGPETYQQDIYNSSNQLISSTWYTTKSSVGSYTGKCRDIIYTIANGAVSSAVTKIYDANGNVLSTSTQTYYISASGNPQVIVENS